MKSPDFKKTWFSYAKVEKVVNPPQNPVANNKVEFWLIVSFFAANPKITPIKRLPKILAVNVPYGKPLLILFKYLPNT